MNDGPLAVAPVRPDIDQRREARPAADTRDAPGALDTFLAGIDVGIADTATATQDFQVDAYKPVIDALLELQPESNFTRYINPQRGTVDPASVWRDVARFQRQGRFKELPATAAEFETQWRATKRGEIEQAEETMSRGNFAAGLAGASIGAMRDPVNISTLPLGGVGKTVAARIINQALTQAAIQTVQLPGVQAQREDLGRRDVTLGEAAMLVGGAAIGGAGFQGVFEGGRFVLPKIAGAIDPNAEAKAMARAFEDMTPANLRTPEEEAALFVLRRAGEVDDASPYVRTHEGMDTHVSKMEAALRALEEGRIARPEELTDAASPVPPASPAPRPVAGSGYDPAAVKAAIAGPESGGNDFATNRMGSSAAGRYQFIEDTFKGLYKRVYGGGDAAAAAAWNSNRKFDGNVQEALMDRLLADNGAALQRAGLPADQGNLYLAHFAGVGKAVELLRAPRDAPVSAFFSAKAIRQNPGYLGGGKTVGEAIDTIRGKVGDPAQASPAPIDPRLLEPELRNPALDAERPVAPLIDEKLADTALPEPVQTLIDPLRDIVTGTKLSLNRLGDLASDLGTDEATLRTALTTLVERGDITQNSATGKFMRKAPPPQTAANQKRPRTLLEFLAERGGVNDYGGDLKGLGIRRSDRKMGRKVIRNVRNEDGTVVSGQGEYGLDTAFQDAREAGFFPELEGRVEDFYADAVDGPAMLLAAINEELSGSPRYRMDDWDRLGEFKLTGTTEEIYGGRITSQQLDGDDPIVQLVNGFREAWEEFGGEPAALDAFDGDFLFRAADFYDRGDAFLPEHALAMVATEDYERALAAAIREGLADEYSTFDPWNPEWDAEFDARFAAARARDRADGNPLAGSEGLTVDEAIGGARGEQPQGGQPSVRPTPAELDAAAAAKPRSDHTDLPPDPDPRFDEPDGPGIVAAAESAWHDIRLAGEADPNIAARARQEAQLKAEAPMRARAEQDGEMGLGLFDAVDQRSLFDLGDGRGERAIADIRAEIDADKAAIDTLRSCLT